MSDTLSPAQTVSLRCPDWCTANHCAPVDVLEEQEYRERVHWFITGKLTDTAGTSLAEVSVIRYDNAVTGEAGQVKVSSFSDDPLEGKQAVQFARLVMQAVTFAEEANRAH